MQLADNAALAEALSPGRKRYFSVVFKVDWDRNGLFTHVDSDLSDVFVSADIDRQLTGNYPAELEINEGFAAAQLTVTLAGRVPSGPPVWRLFSPYAGLYPGTVAVTGTPCYLDVVVLTDDGEVALRQFTGVVQHGVPDRAAGTVTLYVRDAAAELQVPIDLDGWARDYWTTNKLVGSYDDLPESGTITACSVMDTVLRQAGFLEGPPWHQNTVLAWTLRGSALPDVGTYGCEDQYINGTYTFGYGQWTCPQFTPAGTPGEIYGDGKYGKAFRGNSMPDPTDRDVRYVYGNAHANARINPQSYGGASSNLLGMSFWVYIDPAQTTEDSTILFHTEEARYDYSGTNRYPARVLCTVEHNTGKISVSFKEQGWVKEWIKYATVNPAVPGWHFVYVVWHFRPAQLDMYVVADGAVLPLTTVSSPAWPPTTITYNWPESATNLGQVVAYGPLQYVAVFYQANTALAGFITPPSVPVNPRVSLDLSTLRLLWRPRLRSATAWDVLRDVVSADLGVLYVDEWGVVRFQNREAVRARQTTTDPDLNLTLSYVDNLDPASLLDSVVNQLSWTLRLRHAEPYSKAFSSTEPDEFIVAASTTVQPAIRISEWVQSVRLSAVTYRPAAMGYKLDGSANPTAWRDYMTYYAPDTWSDGFTPYKPASRTSPDVQPVPNAGPNVIVSFGWFDYIDQDPTKLRLLLSNPTAFASQYSIDDSTPFLNIAGTVIVTDPDETGSTLDPASVNAFGYRTQSLGGGEWLQDWQTVGELATSLLADTAQPRPYFRQVESLGDPRVQLQDVAQISDAEGVGGPIFASIVGIRRRISIGSGLRDLYTMRTFGASGGQWVLGDEQFSVLGTSTILG